MTERSVKHLTDAFKTLRDEQKPRQNYEELVRLVDELIATATGASFEEVLEAFSALERRGTGMGLVKIERELLELAAKKATTLVDLDRLAQTDETVTRNFRHEFLKRACDLSADLKELISWLRKLGYVN
jgi:hypothetical protein